MSVEQETIAEKAWAVEPPSMAEVPSLLRGVARLHLFRGVLDDVAGRTYLDLLQNVVRGTASYRDTILGGYAQLFSALAEEVEMSASPLVGDPWQNRLLERLLADENPFSLKAQRASIDAMGQSLLAATKHDLRVLRWVFLLDGTAVLKLVNDKLDDDARGIVPWGRFRPMAHHPAPAASSARAKLKAKLASEADWPSLVGDLAAYYAKAGSGLYAKYRAFRWTRREGVGGLEGVEHPDSTSLDELVEYDLERALLLQNTEQFVRGLPANNVLLYGDRGTGKSSTIKALLQKYGALGLRLVEVPKALLGDFPEILSRLRGRRERFILFVDDLSFDEHETSYKDLKAAVEGGIEARPRNVVIYATSNRRHLVQERFSDRGDGEIRTWDTHQEKLSLADRFGITLVFQLPDQPRYLRIVDSLARQRNLQAGPEVLRARALEWAAQQGGFSGRTARQFVDHISGELSLPAR